MFVLYMVEVLVLFVSFIMKTRCVSAIKVVTSSIGDQNT